MRRLLPLLTALLAQACYAQPSLHPPDPRVQRTSYDVGAGLTYLPTHDPDDGGAALRPQVLASAHFLRTRSTRLTLHTNNIFPGLSFQWQFMGQDSPHGVAAAVAPGLITGGYRLLRQDECINPPCSSSTTTDPTAALSLPFSVALPLSASVELLLMLRHDLNLFISGDQAGSGAAAVGLIISPAEAGVSLRLDAVYSHILYTNARRDADDFPFAYPAAQLLLSASIH